jgi:hypothetical protein
VTCHGLNGPGFEFLQGWEVFCYPIQSRLVVGTTQPPIQWVLGSYLEAKLPVDDAGHSPPPSAKVKNEWSYATIPPICMHGVERGKLPFLTFTYEFACQTFWMFLLLQLFCFITYIFSWIIFLLVLNFIQCFINI